MKQEEFTFEMSKEQRANFLYKNKALQDAYIKGCEHQEISFMVKATSFLADKFSHVSNIVSLFKQAMK